MPPDVGDQSAGDDTECDRNKRDDDRVHDDDGRHLMAGHTERPQDGELAPPAADVETMP